MVHFHVHRTAWHPLSQPNAVSASTLAHIKHCVCIIILPARTHTHIHGIVCIIRHVQNKLAVKWMVCVVCILNIM